MQFINTDRMKPFFSTVRVGYSDTDQMGYVHHNNYVKYYETARWQLFEQMNIPYKLVEEKGYMLPVVRMDIKFIKPSYYDDELTIETVLKSIQGAKVCFGYRIFNKAGEIINKAAITLAFIKRDTRQPCAAPDFILEKVK